MRIELGLGQAGMKLWPTFCDGCKIHHKTVQNMKGKNFCDGGNVPSHMLCLFVTVMGYSSLKISFFIIFFAMGYFRRKKLYLVMIFLPSQKLVICDGF